MISVRFNNKSIDRYGKLTAYIPYLREIIGTSVSAIEYEYRMNESVTAQAKSQLGWTTMQRLWELHNKAEKKDAFNPSFIYRDQVVYHLDKTLTQQYFGTVFKIAEMDEIRIGHRVRIDTTISRYECLLDDIFDYLNDAIITLTPVEREIKILKFYMMPSYRELLNNKQLAGKKHFTFSAYELLENVLAEGCEEKEPSEDRCILDVTNVDVIHDYFARMFNLIRNSNDNCRKHIDMEHLLDIGIVCFLYKIASMRMQKLKNLPQEDLEKEKVA